MILKTQVPTVARKQMIIYSTTVNWLTCQNLISTRALNINKIETLFLMFYIHFQQQPPIVYIFIMSCPLVSTLMHHPSPPPSNK